MRSDWKSARRPLTLSHSIVPARRTSIDARSIKASPCQGVPNRNRFVVTWGFWIRPQKDIKMCFNAPDTREVVPGGILLDQTRTSFMTSKPVSSGGEVNPPSIPASMRGIKMVSRNVSHPC
jgi:hypothetical protein